MPHAKIPPAAMPPRISHEQIHAFRLARHHLIAPSKSDLVSVASDVCGIQAQVMGSAHLSLNARIPHITREQIRSALLEKRTLVKAHCMRQTLHLLPSTQYATYIAAIKSSRVADVYRVMTRFKITLQQRDALISAILDALAAAPLTQPALRAKIRPLMPKNVRAWMDRVWGIARPAVVEGLVCYGPDAGNEITLVRTDRWLAKQKAVSPESAQQFLARAYLRAYGPATARDFAHWSGIRMKEVAPLWQSMADEFEEVELADRNAQILKEDAKTLASSRLTKPLLRLLPSFDVYLLAHAEKSHMVHDRHYKRIYRNQGWISPAILLDGEVIGTWSHERGSKAVEIKLEPFEKIPKSLGPQIESEAERLGQFLGAPCKLS